MIDPEQEPQQDDAPAEQESGAGYGNNTEEPEGESR